MVLQAFVPKDEKLESVRFVPAASANMLPVGSQAFFDYFEGRNGRKRITVTVGKNDSWATIAKKNGISVGLLERINQRSHFTKLTPGEALVVYTRSNEKVPSKPASDDANDPYASRDGDDTAAMVDGPPSKAVAD